ncbi:hypothetical protein F5890DRAFT_1593452 [Lentinula detonsa]|uniref:Uncharacterized protein n=1 Tax=Lentinula detonsa TaxID=2804962 RepID=A0AA38UT42_9AGAR|nr:hypothetical protein F5890DRAFT_1593452 [Lentinula detonsa]
MVKSFASRSRAEGDGLNVPTVAESSPRSASSLFRPEDDRPGQADDMVKVQDKDDQVAVDRLDAAQRNSSQSSSAQADRSSSSDTSTHTIKVQDDPDTHETEPPETSFPHTQTLPTCDSMAFSSSRAVHCYTDIDVDESNSHSGVHESPHVMVTAVTAVTPTQNQTSRWPKLGERLRAHRY